MLLSTAGDLESIAPLITVYLEFYVAKKFNLSSYMW